MYLQCAGINAPRRATFPHQGHFHRANCRDLAQLDERAGVWGCGEWRSIRLFIGVYMRWWVCGEVSLKFCKYGGVVECLVWESDRLQNTKQSYSKCGPYMYRTLHGMKTRWICIVSGTSLCTYICKILCGNKYGNTDIGIWSLVWEGKYDNCLPIALPIWSPRCRHILSSKHEHMDNGLRSRRFFSVYICLHRPEGKRLHLTVTYWFCLEVKVNRLNWVSALSVR